MEIRHELKHKHDQKLVITPRLQQLIKMLQLSNFELAERIKEEEGKNLALEIDEREHGDAEEIEPELKENTVLATRTSTVSDEPFPEEPSLSNRSFSNFNRNSGEDPKRDFIENTSSREETLREFLLKQLRLLNIAPEEMRIGEILIDCIDPNGYLSSPIEGVAADFSIPRERLFEVLARIQSLDPPGVGATDLAECLLIQLRNKGDAPLAELIVQKHLGDLRLNKIEEIAKKLKVPPARVKEAFTVISKLEPYPGRPFRSGEIKYIIPEVIVEENEGNFEVFPNGALIPKLRVSSYYEKLARKSNTDKVTRNFAVDKLQAARDFIRSIEQRENTVLRVTKFILEEQREFFERGPKYLKPLTLKDVAGAVGFHESTISRITSSKYVQTPHGVFSLKYFFSNSIPTDGDPPVSKISVKEMIKGIIEGEGGEKHLSDQKIADILKKRGINIARRTVVKYRNELCILSSNLRK